MTKKKKKSNKQIPQQPQVKTPVTKRTNESKRNYLPFIIVALIFIAGVILFFFKGRFISGLKSAGSYKDYNVLLITLDTASR